MIKKLDRYFLTIFTSRMLLTSIVLIAVVWLTKSVQLFQKISDGLPPSLLFLLTIYSLPPFLIEVVPLALFIAVITNLSRLIMDRELVVMQAAGQSLWRLSYPIIFLAALVAILSLYVNLWLVPQSYESLKRLEQTAGQYAHLALKKGQVTSFRDNQHIYIESRDENILYNVMLMTKDLDNNNQETITAKEAIVTQGRDGSSWILLLDGVRSFYDEKAGEFSYLTFASYNVQYQASASKVARATRPRELNPKELRQQLQVAKDPSPYRIELHKRLTSPWLVIAYVLIAIAFLKSGNLLRRTHSKNIFYGILCIVLLKAMHFGLFIIATTNIMLIALVYMLIVVSIIIPAIYIYRARF